jgi:hypothetical protein
LEFLDISEDGVGVTRTGEITPEEGTTSCKYVVEPLLSICPNAGIALGSPEKRSPCCLSWLIPVSRKNGMPSGDFRRTSDETDVEVFSFGTATFMRLEARRAGIGTEEEDMSIDVAALPCLCSLCELT